MTRRSEVADYLICPQRWQYRWQEKLIPPTPSEPLQIGAMIHRILQHWFWMPPEERTIQVLGVLGKTEIELVFGDDQTSTRRRQAHQLRVMLRSHWEHFGSDADIPSGKTEYRMEAEGISCTVDNIINYRGGLWIMEHKTGTPDVATLVLDSFQTDLYHAVARQCGLNTVGTIITVIERPKSERLQQVSAQRYEMEPTEGQVNDAWLTAKTVDSRIRNDSTPAVYRHRGEHCRWCDFQILCRVALFGGDVDEAMQDHYHIAKEE